MIAEDKLTMQTLKFNYIQTWLPCPLNSVGTVKVLREFREEKQLMKYRLKAKRKIRYVC